MNVDRVRHRSWKNVDRVRHREWVNVRYRSWVNVRHRSWVNVKHRSWANVTRVRHRSQVNMGRVRHRSWVGTWVLWGWRCRGWGLDTESSLCNILRLRICRRTGVGGARKGGCTFIADEMEDTQR